MPQGKLTGDRGERVVGHPSTEPRNTSSGMAMGTRKQREKQEGLWIAQQESAVAPAHPFYQKRKELLEAER